MASILSRDDLSLFVSYGPGTGSTALEQHLRSCGDDLEKLGFCIEHIPEEEFGVNSVVSRHICYADFLMKYKRRCDYVVTATRNPFSYYFSEYKRINAKWVHLLGDKSSWLYSQESKSTLDLVIASQSAVNFDAWLHGVLVGAQNKGYLAINEDHMNMATHFIRSETIDASFDELFSDIFNLHILQHIGPFPRVNVTSSDVIFCSGISESTLELGFSLFGYYMGKFNYTFQDSGLFVLMD
jgi:hypothetical protein